MWRSISLLLVLVAGCTADSQSHSSPTQTANSTSERHSHSRRTEMVANVSKSEESGYDTYVVLHWESRTTPKGVEYFIFSLSPTSPNDPCGSGTLTHYWVWDSDKLSAVEDKACMTMGNMTTITVKLDSIHLGYGPTE